jgi:hypothetical protein
LIFDSSISDKHFLFRRGKKIRNGHLVLGKVQACTNLESSLKSFPFIIRFRVVIALKIIFSVVAVLP